MSDTEREESNTNHAESNMSTAQIGHNGPPPPIAKETRDKLEGLTRLFHRGSYDTWTAARDRASEKIGLDKKYAKTIWQRWETMRDVSGDAYRTINTAYKEMCERIEADTEHRRFVRGTVSNAAHQGNLEQSERTDLVEQDHFPRD